MLYYSLIWTYVNTRTLYEILLKTDANFILTSIKIINYDN